MPNIVCYFFNIDKVFIRIINSHSHEKLICGEQADMAYDLIVRPFSALPKAHTVVLFSASVQGYL